MSSLRTKNIHKVKQDSNIKSNVLLFFQLKTDVLQNVNEFKTLNKVDCGLDYETQRLI